VIEQAVRAGNLDFIAEEALLDYVQSRRWFGSKSEEVNHASVLETGLLRDVPPLFGLWLVEMRFHVVSQYLF
jgi:hypothetical protein